MMVRLVSRVVLCAMALAVFLLVMLVITGVARAAVPWGNCGTRAAVVASLNDKFGETRQGMGIAANRTLMEIWASAKSGTWTISVTMPSGVTCLVASGEGYEGVQEALPPPGDAL